MRGRVVSLSRSRMLSWPYFKSGLRKNSIRRRPVLISKALGEATMTSRMVSVEKSVCQLPGDS
jgi:hypothetical protein